MGFLSSSWEVFLSVVYTVLSLYISFVGLFYTIIIIEFLGVVYL